MNTTIKAIETRYKGYRFRSRLEARWAVFFDALGIKWEYEKEGYDLGAAGWYLPDFWLPQTESFIEVKPEAAILNPTVKLYLAGKFTGGSVSSRRHQRYDWREDYFGISFVENHFYDASDLPEKKTVFSNCGYLYVGPFPIDLTGGHGSTPGHFEEYDHDDDDNQTVEEFYEEAYGKDSDEFRAYLLRQQQRTAEPVPRTRSLGCEHQTVVEKCLKQIDFADTVFAWIDSERCYGTLVEIGYAKAKGKKLIVGVSDTLKNSYDMWFAQQIADTCVIAKNPRQAFDHVFELDQEETKARDLAKYSSKKVGIVYGDPLDHAFGVFYPDSFLLKTSKNHWKGIGGIESLLPVEVRVKSRYAAEAARAARFEHGERGL